MTDAAIAAGDPHTKHSVYVYYELATRLPDVFPPIHRTPRFDRRGVSISDLALASAPAHFILAFRLRLSTTEWLPTASHVPKSSSVNSSCSSTSCSGGLGSRFRHSLTARRPTCSSAHLPQVRLFPVNMRPAVLHGFSNQLSYKWPRAPTKRNTKLGYFQNHIRYPPVHAHAVFRLLRSRLRARAWFWRRIRRCSSPAALRTGFADGWTNR